MDSGEVGGFLSVEKGFLHNGARCHDPCYLSFYKPFRPGGIFHLVTDGYIVPRLDESRQVSLGSVIRDTAHGYGIFLALVPRRESDLQDIRRQNGIVHEHLVKVTHPEEEDRVWMFPLDGKILLHHRCAGATGYFGGLFHLFKISTGTEKRLWIFSDRIMASTESVNGPKTM